MNDSEILLVTVSGGDRPGITARLTGLLAAHDVELLDIGQANTHDWMTFAMLIKLAPGSEAVRQLLFEAHGLDLQVRFTPVPAEAYERWVGEQGKERWIISLMSRQLAADAISRLAGILSLSGLNIDNITRLSGRTSLSGDVAAVSCVEFSVRGEAAAQLGDAFLGVARELKVDIAVQRDDAYHTVRRMLLFDTDTIPFASDPLAALARAAGRNEQDAALAAEPPSADRMSRRVALLEGLELERAEEAASAVPLADGAEELLTTIHRLGFSSAVVTSGLALFGQQLQHRLGVDFVVGTGLEVADGRLTGALTGEPGSPQDKIAQMQALASKAGLRPEQVVAVGSDERDLPLLAAAGVGVTCCSGLGLDRLLYVIGIHQRESRR